MEELKNLTTEQLKKVIQEIYKEIDERKDEERKNAYRNLINAMKTFRETGLLISNECYFTVCCEECESEIDIDFFENFNAIIKELERGL